MSKNLSDKMYGFYRHSYRCLLCFSEYRGWKKWRTHVKKNHDLTNPVFDK
jgi:hypothetical protein